ncbi:hypothetical protein VaNZ11_008302 [Volvox africanus]|uniref:Armadillo repeat-containing domain-containing protein n=1 Tax=Volvox africanus TaxID=51714 RepID=A0ABQ5S636_9CHLO|nr:hypothetical protein VaNZ11_008302 [Volvox africanus]
MSAAEAVVSEEERRKKSVYYEACTSPFKDDFPTLVKCLRSPEPGNPHTRQEAGFLLWHHALEGDDIVGLMSAGLLTACVANLDGPDLLPADKACSAGILVALLCDDEDMSEQLVRSRGPTGRTALEILHAVLHDDAALARQYCSRLLLALAQQVGPSVLRAMDNQLPYLSTYLELWGIKGHRDPIAVAATVEAVDLLLGQRPELASSMVEAGGVGALMDVVRSHKSEAAVGTALHCLLRLLPMETAMEQLINGGGIALLVDVLGPPPKAALENRPEVIEEEESLVASGLGTPQPPPSLSAAATAVAAAAAPWSSQFDDGAEIVGEMAEDYAAEDGGGADGSADGGIAGPDAAATSPSDPDPDLHPDGTCRTNSQEHFSALKDLRSGSSSSPASSPTARSSKMVGGVGEGGGWTSTRTSHRSLGSHGSSSMQLRVQLPLVIPGIHTPSGATAAAALLGCPSLQPLPSARSFRSPTGGDPASAGLTVDGSGDGPAGGGGGGEGTAIANGSMTGMLGMEARPPLPSADDLSANRSGLRWILLPGLEVASRAAACLTLAMQRPECQVAAELRLASHRLVAQMKAVLGPKAGAEGTGSGKKGKKKGLGLTAAQTTALTRLMGMTKFLLLHNITKYRIAKLGAVPFLVRLYSEANDYLLRNHCQAILAHVALLAENGVALQEAKMPEEFLVANPMHLTSYERAVLRIEFPDDPALVRR